MKTKTVYCVTCGKDTEHTGSIDANNELVLTCKCGSFLKFPTEGLTAKKLDKLLAKYKHEHQAMAEAVAAEEEKEVRLEELLG